MDQPLTKSCTFDEDAIIRKIRWYAAGNCTYLIEFYDSDSKLIAKVGEKTYDWTPCDAKLEKGAVIVGGRTGADANYSN